MYKRTQYPTTKSHIGMPTDNNEVVIKFFTIVSDKNLSDIKSFISLNKVNINSQNDNSDTAMHILLQGANYKEDSNLEPIVKFLISCGASVNRGNKQNIYPIHLAISSQLYLVTKLLIENNANLLVLDSNGMNVLHHYVSSKNIECYDKIIVKPIIPNPEKILPDEIFSNISLAVVNLLQSVPFKSVFKHISQSCNSLNRIYPQLIISVDDEFRKGSTNILSNMNLSFNEKRGLLLNHTNKIGKNIYDNITKKLSTTLKPLDLKFEYEDGWKISDKYKGVLPYENNIADISNINLEKSLSELKVLGNDVNSRFFLNELDPNNFTIMNNYMIDVEVNFRKAYYTFINFFTNSPNITNPNDLNLIDNFYKKMFINFDQDKANSFMVGATNTRNRIMRNIDANFEPDRYGFNRDDYNDPNYDNTIKSILTFDMGIDPRAVNLGGQQFDINLWNITQNNIEDFIAAGIVTDQIIMDFNNIVQSNNNMFGIIGNQLPLIWPYLFARFNIKDMCDRIFNDITILNNYPGKEESIIRITNVANCLIVLVKNLFTLDRSDLDFELGTIGYIVNEWYKDIIKNPRIPVAGDYHLDYLYRIKQSVEFMSNTIKFKEISDIVNKMYGDVIKIASYINKYMDILSQDNALEYINSYNNYNNTTFIDNAQLHSIDKFIASTITTNIKLPQKLSEFDIKIIDSKLVRDIMFNINVHNSFLIYDINPIYGIKNMKLGYLIDATLDAYFNISAIPNIDIIGGFLSNDPEILDGDPTKIGSYGLKNTSYDYFIETKVPESIGDYLDNHFHTIRYRIVQSIIKHVTAENNIDILYYGDLINSQETDILKDEGKEFKNKMVTLYKMTDAEIANLDIIMPMVITVGKIIDSMVVSYIDNSVANFCKNYVQDKIESIDSISVKPVLFMDKNRQYEFNLNYIIQDIKELYSDDNIYQAMFNQNLIKTEDTLNIINPDIYVLYSQNYDNSGFNTCVVNNSKILTTLLNKVTHSIINMKDHSGMTPLTYGITQSNENLVRNITKTFKFTGKLKTSLINYAKQNLENIKPHSEFHINMHTDIMKNILAKTEFGNNVITSLDIILEQTINIYSLIFYNKTINYWNFYTHNDFVRFLTIAEKRDKVKANIELDDLPFIQFVKDNALKYYESKSDFSLPKNDFSLVNDKIHTEKIKHARIIRHQYDQAALSRNNQKRIIINKVPLMLQKYISEENRVKDDIKTSRPSKISKEAYNKSKNILLSRIRNFVDQEDTVQTLENFYNTIFSEKERETEYYGLFYTNLWKEYLLHTRQESYVKNIVELTIGISDPKYIDDIITLNETVIVNMVESYKNRDDSLQQYSVMKNHIYYTIVHIVRTNILSNMYYAIMKHILTYIRETLSQYNSISDKNNTKIGKKLDTIIGKNGNINSNEYSKIKSYIVDEMALSLVRIIFGDIASDEKLSVDSIFSQLSSLLLSDVTLNVTEGSEFMNVLNDKLIPYYKMLILECVPKMKMLIDSYNNYIINNHRNMLIYKELLK